MVEIAKCRCGANGRLLKGPSYASVDCSGPACWTGPIHTTEVEAIAAWNALMSPAPEPAAGVVRVPVQVSAVVREMQEQTEDGWRSVYALIHTVLANDGTMWIRNWHVGDGIWVQLNPLPQPAEIPGTVENGE